MMDWVLAWRITHPYQQITPQNSSPAAPPPPPRLTPRTESEERKANRDERLQVTWHLQTYFWFHLPKPPHSRTQIPYSRFDASLLPSTALSTLATGNLPLLLSESVILSYSYYRLNFPERSLSAQLLSSMCENLIVLW